MSFELDTIGHWSFVEAELRALIPDGTFAGNLRRQLGSELHYRLVDYPDDEEVQFSRLDPVRALFHSVSGGWTFDPLWLAVRHGGFVGDNGSRLADRIEHPVFTEVEHLAAYGLWLVDVEIHTLGEIPSSGIGNLGWSREDVQRHQAACLLFGSQAIVYAQKFLSGAKFSEEEIAKSARAATARKAADARHAKDPKQSAKTFVYDCWRSWRTSPERYVSTVAFARDMLDKQPILESEVVISRWVRQWDKQA